LSQSLDITVVVPVFNSVQTLEPLFKRIRSVMELEQLTFEVLFVEDGGANESWAELKRIKASYPEQIRLVRFARNYGQNAATVCGISQALGANIITIDDDLQTPPEEIPKLLKAQKQSGADVVFGVTSEQNNPFVKRAGSSALKWIFKWIDGSDLGSSFRFIGQQLKEKLVKQSHDQLFLNQVIHWYTDEIVKVEVVHESRSEGNSGYSVLGLLRISVKLIFFYTDFPLRVMSIAGLIFAAVCFGLGVYYIYERLVLGAAPGFASIITAIFFATGIIMICLSVLGAYISRIYADRIRKPVYSIKSIV